MFKKVTAFMNSIAKQFSETISFNRLSPLEKASKIKMPSAKKVDVSKLSKLGSSSFLHKKEK